MRISMYTSHPLSMTQPGYREIAQTLIALTQLPHATVAKRAEVQRSNLVNWLNGKDQVLSLDKQLRVCSVLGWHFGGLQREVVHRFVVEDDLTALIRVLACFDHNTPFPRLYIFPTEGRMAMHGAVILAWKTGEYLPLVMLASRPLTGEPWTPLSATQFTGAKAGKLHSVSDMEWLNWWRPDTTHVDSQDYLQQYGDPLLEYVEMAENDNVHRVEDEQPDTDWFPHLRGRTLTERQIHWLNLLKQAEARGMSFEKIMTTTRSALLKKNCQDS